MTEAYWGPEAYHALGTAILWVTGIVTVLLLVFIGFVVYPFKDK